MPGHVVFLECYPHVRGGAQATTAALAVALPERGWSTEVVAPADGPALEAYRVAGTRTTVVPASRALLRFGGSHAVRDRVAAALAEPAWTVRLARHLRRADATLLDVVDQRGVVLGAPAATIARVKGIWHVHTPGAPSSIDTVGRRWARCCIVPSRGAARRFGDDAAIVAPALAADVPMRPPSAGRGAPRLVSAGRVHPVKGFDVLIDAVARVRSGHPDVSLEIFGAPQAGHENHARALESQVARLDLDDHVRFCGHVACPWTKWDGAALYVQASRDEPFGIALIEAMAYGLPVVATRVAGPSEIVDDGRTGLLVPPGDRAALAAAIERMLDDSELAHRLARAGQAHVRETYTLERLVDRTAHVFDRALV